jgi:excisionase family DNA binding protein
MEKKEAIPILIPFEPEDFWAQMRIIIREEVVKSQKGQFPSNSLLETPGLTEKPLYKIQEICSLFRISKPTIYDWIKNGKLKRIKIRSRVYFLGSDIRSLMQT